MDFFLGLVIGLLASGAGPSTPMDRETEVLLSCGLVVVCVLVVIAIVRAMRRSL